jgi:hypothetical protein
MRLHHSSLLLCAFASFGLVACGDDPATPTDGGTDAGASDAPAVTDTPVTTDTPAADVPAAAQTFSAALSGRQEVPAVYDTTATGTATFTLSADRTSLTVMVTHTILLPTGAHIHTGLAGEAGAVLVPLSTTPAVITGTVTVTAEQAAAIEEGRAYVNIHTAAHPDGEIRGQIVRPGETLYVARLSPDQENPPTASTGSGLGEFLVNPATLRVRYVVRTAGLTGPATMAHIHTGAAGTNGGVTVDFGSTLGATIAGERPITAVTDLEAGRWYANVHTAMAPGGEIRGQILRPGEQLFIGRMTGAEEVPAVTTTATGSTGVIVGADRDRLTYDGTVTGMTPTAAHLHEAPAGMNGSVVVPFDVTGMTFRGTFTVLPTSTVVAALNAGNVYANAHSTMFAGGEIRGQMRRAPAAQ